MTTLRLLGVGMERQEQAELRAPPWNCVRQVGVPTAVVVCGFVDVDVVHGLVLPRLTLGAAEDGMTVAPRAQLEVALIATTG